MGENKRRTVAVDKMISYVMGVPRAEEEIMDISQLVERLKQTPLFELLDIRMDDEGDPILLVAYREKQYEVKLILEEVKIPSLFTINHQFSEVDINAFKEAKHGITTAMTFSEDFFESYHVQLKVLSALIPDLLGVVDFSAERIYSGVWATLAASSQVPPSPEYLYSIQAISDEEEDVVWLHTHGLNRCGRMEIEILNADKTYYENYVPIIQGYADRLLTQKLENIGVEGEAEVIAYTNDRQPIVATWIPWMKAVSLYDETMLGGAKSHEEHNQPAGAIFFYLDKAHYDEGKFSPFRALGNELHDNVMVLFSNQETERMQSLARERFAYFADCVGKTDYHGIAKFGLEIDEQYKRENKSEREHIWFEVLAVNGNKMKAKLTQAPYMIDDLKEGDVLELDVSQLTDWLIFTPKYRVNPDRVYLLEMME